MQHKPSETSLAPFSCQYSAQIPELLSRLGCTIAISTYQAGKLIFLSAKDENSLVQLQGPFPSQWELPNILQAGNWLSHARMK